MHLKWIPGKIKLSGGTVTVTLCTGVAC